MKKIRTVDKLEIDGLSDLLASIGQIDHNIKKLYVRVDTTNRVSVLVAVETKTPVSEYKVIDNLFSTTFMKVCHIDDLDNVEMSLGVPLGEYSDQVTWYNATPIIKRVKNANLDNLNALKRSINITDDIGLCMMYLAWYIKLEIMIFSEDSNTKDIRDYGVSKDFLCNLYEFADVFGSYGKQTSYKYFRELCKEADIINKYCEDCGIKLRL